MFLYGYPHVPRLSTGVHDPLQCAALYLTDGDREILFLANDLICVPRAFVAEVRQQITRRTGIPAAAILISATHTHSGPVMVDHISNAADPVVPPAEPVFLALVAERMVAAAESAKRAAVPAEAGLVVAQAKGVGSNRHDPEGPTDPAVPVMVVRRRSDSRPIACLLVYGMHPTVLHEDSTLVSADFPFFTRQFLRQSVLPADCPVLFHNGVSGDQSPRHVVRANTFAEARRIGEMLGQAVAAAVERMVFSGELRVAARSTSVDLVMRRFPSVAEATEALRTIRSRHEALRRSGAGRAVVRTALCDVFGAEETIELARAAADGRLQAAVAERTPAEIQLLSIGRWRFIGWPGEFFVEYGLAVKAQAPDAFVITLANGELQGYVVTPEADARGTYEARNAIFAPENGARFVSATLALLAAGDPR